jgi:hypothetical protein
LGFSGKMEFTFPPTVTAMAGYSKTRQSIDVARPTSRPESNRYLADGAGHSALAAGLYPILPKVLKLTTGLASPF